MKKIIYLVFLIISFISCSSKQVQLSQSEIKFMTTRQFEVEYSTVFKSVISLFQSEGFFIESTDKETGLITAYKRLEGKKDGSQLTSKSRIMTVVSSINKGTTEVKYTIYEGLQGKPHWWAEKIDTESMAQNATIYNGWFNSLRTEIERIKALQ